MRNMTPKLTSHYSQVVAPSTFKNTPVHHVAIPLLRFVNVRTPLSYPFRITAIHPTKNSYTEFPPPSNHPTQVNFPTNTISSFSNRQLGHESQEKKDHRHRPNAPHERRTSEIQKRIPDWSAEGGEGREGECLAGARSKRFLAFLLLVRVAS